MSPSPFVELLPVIDAVIRHVSSRARLSGDERAEFSSIVLLKLIENDYAVLRAFRRNSSVTTYLTAVVRRCLLDVRIKEWGKWRPTRVARRLGPLATTLERLVTRDNLPMQQVVPALKHHPAFKASSSEVWRLHEALPPRGPRRKQVELPSNLEVHDPHRADALIDAGHLEQQAARVRIALTRVIASLPADDRRLLRLRFQDDLRIARIASMTGETPSSLYRRLSTLLTTVRVRLMEHRLTATDIRPLIGNSTIGIEGVLAPSAPPREF
jgi:RNA polymerase sigma factor (sigma-70 family)